MGSPNQMHPLVWQAAFRRSVPGLRLGWVSAPAGVGSFENIMWRAAQ